MKVFYLTEIVDFIEELTLQDHARVSRTRYLFEQYGFSIGQKYVKKITRDLWELRAGRIRLFLYIRGDQAFGVHIIYKKSQRLPKKDIDLAEKRINRI